MNQYIHSALQSHFSIGYFLRLLTRQRFDNMTAPVVKNVFFLIYAFHIWYVALLSCVCMSGTGNFGNNLLCVALKMQIHQASS